MDNSININRDSSEAGNSEHVARRVDIELAKVAAGCKG